MSGDERYLVVGSGSIARRHIANLKVLFAEGKVACVSASGRQLTTAETGAHRVFGSLENAIDWAPRLAVVASPAPWHVSQAAALVSAGVPTLIEKPLSSSLADFAKGGDVLLAHKEKADVAYTLRHLPSATALKALLDSQRIGHVRSVLVDVGQYLPDWRTGSDYRLNVSAQRRLGGGVLLELSHELDYLTWLFGGFDTAYCIASTTGALDIDVEDRVDALLQRSDGLVANLHMDFLQRSACRVCKVIGERGNLVWDLARNRIDLHRSMGRSECLFDGDGFDRNDMYLAQLAQFARVAKGELDPLVGLDSALRTLQLIDALKRSAETGRAVAIEEHR